MSDNSSRLPLAVITGAAGGMGRACSGVLGRRYRLVLAEYNGDALADLAASLRTDGVEVVAEIAGDIGSSDHIAAIADAAKAGGGVAALVHTAGISPSMGPWDKVLAVNLIATLRLLDALEPLLLPRAAGVLIASLAAQRYPGTDAIDAVLRGLRGDSDIGELEGLVRANAASQAPLSLGVSAYGLSKYAVMRLCETRAESWGRRGCRLNSISPGMIATPMGLMEAEGNPAASGLVELAPAGRWGTPNDIADGVEFLLSDAASFVTGCDLRVDGGLAGKLRSL
jgi:NAD(P)-dependent dehydrogenase (short-subunit alcohol dehydrogenase family)